MHSVLLFPGQGAYNDHLVRALGRDFPGLADVYAEVDKGAEAAGVAPVSGVLLADEPPSVDELLTQAPDTLQLSIYAVSVGVHRLLVHDGAAPSAHVGHSLGEIAALTTAGAFSIGDGAEIVAHRTAALRSAGRTGRMVALACGVRRAEQILTLVGDPQAAVAAANSPAQTIVSGPEPEIEAVSAVARSLHIGAVPLKAPYPFHSPALTGVTDDFAGRIQHLVARPLEVPVYSPILGRYYESGEDVGPLIASHLVQRVRFADAVRQLRAAGADIFVECGSGSTLCGLVEDSAERVQSLPSTERRRGPRQSIAAAAQLLSRGAPVGLRPPLSEPAPAHVDGPATPPASSAPDQAAGRPATREQLFAELRSMYAEALEYPPEVFTEDVALEADLGIDSVKQTELFARTVERYGLPERSEGLQLTDYDTVGKVVDLVWSLLLDVTRAFTSSMVVAGGLGDSGRPTDAPPTTITRERLFAELRSMYAEALEYPPEVFTEDVALEADLGIDSVKQTELFARTVERYGLPERSEGLQLTDYDTMGKVVDLVWSLHPAATAEPVAPGGLRSVA